MPNRILHEKICTSETLALLSAEEERFFYRLMVQCDDYGRFDGRPMVIRARCFAVQVDSVSDDDVAHWLDALVRVGLVVRYEVGGRAFLQVETFNKYQTPRAKRSKWPDPLDHSQEPASTCEQTPADSSVFVSGIRSSIFDVRDSDSESDSPPEGEADHGAGAPPKPKRGSKAARTMPPETLEPNDADYATGAEVGLTVDEVDSKAAEMLDHWRAKGELRADWHASLRTWLRNSQKFDGPHGSPNHRNGSSRPPPNGGNRPPIASTTSELLMGRNGPIPRR